MFPLQPTSMTLLLARYVFLQWRTWLFFGISLAWLLWTPPNQDRMPRFTPPAPYVLEDNQESLLDCTDLVFINPDWNRIFDSGRAV